MPIARAYPRTREYDCRSFAEVKMRARFAVERRGPYVCVAARNPDDTPKIFEKLREAEVFVSLRENAIPHRSAYLQYARACRARLMEVLSA